MVVLSPKMFLQNELLSYTHTSVSRWDTDKWDNGDSRKSTPSPLGCLQKTIHQARADPFACVSALSANRLNPSSTLTSILTLLLLSSMTEWHILGIQTCNPSTGRA